MVVRRWLRDVLRWRLLILHLLFSARVELLRGFFVLFKRWRKGGSSVRIPALYPPSSFSSALLRHLFRLAVLAMRQWEWVSSGSKRYTTLGSGLVAGNGAQRTG